MSQETKANSSLTDLLKSSEQAIKQAVAQYGNQHPIVVDLLDKHVSLLRQAGETVQADKFAEKVKILRSLQTHSKQSESTTQATVATSTETKPEEVVTTSSLSKEEAAARLEAKAKAAREARERAEAEEKAEQTEEIDEDELIAQALAAVQNSQTNQLNNKETNSKLEAEKHLFNSHGQHIAVYADDHIWTRMGEHLARWDSTMEAFIDRKGNYFGHIVEHNRLAKDTNWSYKHMNFGDRGNAGNRAGWGYVSDVERTFLPYGYEDLDLE